MQARLDASLRIKLRTAAKPLTSGALWYYNMSMADAERNPLCRKFNNASVGAIILHICHAFRMYTPLGQRLKELRTERNLTQRRLASDLSIRTVTYLRYEKSQREPPISLLVTIARYYGITVDDLLGLK